jgi:hypothetical protein
MNAHLTHKNIVLYCCNMFRRRVRNLQGALQQNLKLTKIYYKGNSYFTAFMQLVSPRGFLNFKQYLKTIKRQFLPPWLYFFLICCLFLSFPYRQLILSSILYP